MIRDVHHIGVVVRDLEGTAAFYQDALRLPVVKEVDLAERGARVRLLAVGGSYLELIQPIGHDSPFAAYVSERGEGLHHLALWSDDINGQVAALHRQEAMLVDPEPRDGSTGRLSFLAPEAFDGALLEIVEPWPELRGSPAPDGPVARIDHVVLHLPDVEGACRRFREYFDLPTKRTMERGNRRFAFLRPGDVTVEVVGPKEAGQTGTGRVAGVAFEVEGIEALADTLRAGGFPVGDPHPALQGGRIGSVHASGACGVPVAFIDFSKNDN